MTDGEKMIWTSMFTLAMHAGASTQRAAASATQAVTRARNLRDTARVDLTKVEPEALVMLETVIGGGDGP